MHESQILWQTSGKYRGEPMSVRHYQSSLSMSRCQLMEVLLIQQVSPHGWKWWLACPWAFQKKQSEPLVPYLSINIGVFMGVSMVPMWNKPLKDVVKDCRSILCQLSPVRLPKQYQEPSRMWTSSPKGTPMRTSCFTYWRSARATSSTTGSFCALAV